MHLDTRIDIYVFTRVNVLPTKLWDLYINIYVYASYRITFFFYRKIEQKVIIANSGKEKLYMYIDYWYREKYGRYRLSVWCGKLKQLQAQLPRNTLTDLRLLSAVGQRNGWIRFVALLWHFTCILIEVHFTVMFQFAGFTFRSSVCKMWVPGMCETVDVLIEYIATFVTQWHWRQMVLVFIYKTMSHHKSKIENDQSTRNK